MMRNAIITKVVGKGIVLIASEFGEQMWTECKVKKHKKCLVTGMDLAGKFAYRPITNSGNRMERISAIIINTKITQYKTPIEIL
jgi:hypothetical protein